MAGSKRYTLTVEVPDDSHLPATVRLRNMLKRIWRGQRIRCVELAEDREDHGEGEERQR